MSLNHTARSIKQNKKGSKWFGPNVQHQIGSNMLYDYYCEQCNETWEESHLSADRDKPVGQPCPCGKSGTIKRGVCAPAIVSDSIHPIKRAGNEWNDVLKGIKKASGKENTIDTY